MSLVFIQPIPYIPTKPSTYSKTDNKFAFLSTNYSYLTRLTNVPIFSIATLISSLFLKTTRGSRKYPIPAGVPVKKIVPGSSVVPCERNDICFLIEKIMSFVCPSWTTLPLCIAFMDNVCGSLITAGETRIGPRRNNKQLHLSR